jgi:signal transduction histidine kinase
MSASKILNFLVNDILDFSQLRFGIFRKDIFNFNIKDSIEEIVHIQQDKAEFQGIQLFYDLENFADDIENSEDSFIVCTDQRRL